MNHGSIDSYVADFESLPQLQDADLNEQRKTGLMLFRQNGFPTTRHEDWKYTDVRSLARKTFNNKISNRVGIGKAELEAIRFADLNCLELVFVNGIYSAKLSRLQGLPSSAIICNLAEALDKHNDLLKLHLGKYVNNKASTFAALNTAFVQHGIFIYLPCNTLIAQPVHLLYLCKGEEQEFAVHPRNVIVIEDDSEATIIESYIGLDDINYFTNVVTEISLGQAARLHHYKLQQESVNGYHIGNLNARQDRDSCLELYLISLGGSLVRNDIHSKLDAAGASIVMNGLYMAKNKQHVDNHTRVDHLKPDTYSTENYRGVLNDYSRGVFNGKVVVHPDAQKIEAHQHNANLLLSDDAEVYTKPELEIYADDVKCSHGATVGQLDKNMLFYLRSRAIDEGTARILLTFAFADEAIKNIGLEPVRNWLECLIVGQLPDANLIREFINE